MEIIDSVDVTSVLRDQFVTFDAIGGAIRLNSDRQRRVLLLAADDWPDRLDSKRGAPLPTEPAPPIMLQRLATVAYRLACLADRKHGTTP